MNYPTAALGGNVHSTFTPRVQIPEFQQFRFDMAGFHGSPKDVVAHYGNVLWLVSNADDILALVDAGIKGACVEGPDEPHLAFPSMNGYRARPAYSVEDYLTVMPPMYKLCNNHGYTLLGIGSANWKDDGLAWTKATVKAGILSWCDGIATHFYREHTEADVKRIITTKNSIVGPYYARKPFFCTENLADLTPALLKLKVPSFVYDIPFTDPNTSLLDADGKPTKIYTDLRMAIAPKEVN